MASPEGEEPSTALAQVRILNWSAERNYKIVVTFSTQLSAMKKFFFVTGAFVTALFIYAFVPKHNLSPKNLSQYKKNNTVSCTPDRKALSQLLDSLDIPPMPGAGIYKWKITTANDSAQFYFNQGINMYYGFHIIESLASFKKASRFDPENAMIWWAQALAYGPNIIDVCYSASPDTLIAIE